MFSEMDFLHEMMEDGMSSPYAEPVDERARRYFREKESGETTLPYDQWCREVWYPKYGSRTKPKQEPFAY